MTIATRTARWAVGALLAVSALATQARAQGSTPTPATTPATTPASPSPVVNTGLTGIEAMTATVFQKGQSSFSGVALRVRLKDARLLPSIELLPTVEYWRNSTSIGAFGIKAVRRDATLGTDARWLFPGDNWRLYAGAGLAVHFLDSEVDAPSLGLNDASHGLTKGGLGLLGGIAFGTKSRLGNFLEVKGHLVGDYEQLKINMGLSWNMANKK